MTDKRFCELDTEITGEKIDNILQLETACFNGIELKEYVEHFIEAENEACAVICDERANYLGCQTIQILPAFAVLQATAEAIRARR